MRVLAVANAKGGTGKTSTAVNLATGAARAGLRTLLVDLDSQANASTWLLGSLPADALGSADALTSGELRPEMLRAVPNREGLTVLPATPALSRAEREVADQIGGETMLRDALEGHAGRFDLAILDCPPNLGVTVLNALAASDGVLAPVLPAFLALSGLQRLEAVVERARSKLKNVRTYVLGYLLFGVDSREAISAEARDLLREQTGEKLLRSEVRVSTAAKSLPAHNLTSWDAGADPRGAEDYAAALAEVLARLEQTGTKRKRK